MLSETIYDSLPLCGRLSFAFIKGPCWWKRKEGSQPRDERRIIKFKWMPTFTNSNFMEIANQSTGLRTHGHKGYKHRIQNKKIKNKQTSLAERLKSSSVTRPKEMEQYTTTAKTGREMFYPCVVLIQWSPLLLKQSCWRRHRTLEGLGPLGRWGKIPMKRIKQGPC